MSNVMVMQYDLLNRGEKYASQYISDDDYRNNLNLKKIKLNNLR